MTVQEAEELIRQAENNADMTEDDEFELTEALTFLINETHDPRYMMPLGGSTMKKGSSISR